MEKAQNQKGNIIIPPNNNQRSETQPPLVKLVDTHEQPVHEPVPAQADLLQQAIAAVETRHYQLTAASKQALATQAAQTLDSLQFLPQIQTITQTAQVKLMVTYHYSSGQIAAPSKSLTLPFVRRGERNLAATDPAQAVTWSAWTYADTGAMPAIASPLIQQPVPGFSGQPNQKQVWLTASDLASLQLQLVDDEKTTWLKHVTYPALRQQATVTYFDDDENKVLAIDRVWGYFGAPINFPVEINERAATFKNQHLLLVTENLPLNPHYRLGNNEFAVHFKHEHQALNRQTTAITLKISYQYGDGTPTGIKPVQQRMFFSRDGWQDLATGNAHWQKWEQTGRLQAVVSPKLASPKAGFSSLPETQLVAVSQQELADLDGLNRPGSDLVINKRVVYPAVKAAQTAAAITFFDDEQGKPLIMEAASIHGAIGDKVSFSIDPKTRIADYLRQGYQLDSAKSNWPDGGAKFKADRLANNYSVHFVHRHEKQTVLAKVTERIHYVSTMGSPLQDPDQRELRFNRTYLEDKVTGQRDWLSDWTPETGRNFAALSAPKLPGYRSLIPRLDAESIDLQTLTADSARVIEKTFVYARDSEQVGQAVLTIVDAEEKRPLSSAVVTGVLGQTIKFQPPVVEQLKQLKQAGWAKRASNWQEDVKFLAKPQQFVVELTHQRKSLGKQTSSVLRVVEFVLADGSSLGVPAAKQTVIYEREGQLDLITKKQTWGKWQANHELTDLPAPKIAGYKPEKSVIAPPAVDLSKLVVGNQLELRQKVIYREQAGVAKFVFIDDATQTEVAVIESAGKIGAKVAWPAERTATLVMQKGYQIAATDWSKQASFTDGPLTLTVHLQHAVKKLTEQAQARWEVAFCLTDGTEVAPQSVQELNFTRQGTHDLVTDEVEWQDWQSKDSFQEVTAKRVAGYLPEAAGLAAPRIETARLNAEQPLVIHGQINYQLVPSQSWSIPANTEQTSTRVEEDNRSAWRKQRRHAAQRQRTTLVPRPSSSRILGRIITRSRFYH